MVRPPPRSTLTDTHFPYTKICRSPLSHIQMYRSKFRYFDANSKYYYPLVLKQRMNRGSEMFGKIGLAVMVLMLTACANMGGNSEDRMSSTYRSEEHTSELQSLMRSSYTACCLKKKRKQLKEH